MSNLSPAALQKMATLHHMTERVQHIHGLVERFATTRDPKLAEPLVQPMKRAFSRLKLELSGAGLDTLSQLAGSMEVAAGRGGSIQMKIRILREGVGSIRFQLDQEARSVASEDQAAQARVKAAEAMLAADQEAEGADGS
jgi:hypothetical protein